jgi:hypothetical protein
VNTNFPFYSGKVLIKLALIGSVVLLGGCATGYNQQMTSTVNSAKSGGVDDALAKTEKDNPSKDKDLLYFLEKGELLRMKGDYSTSRDTWLLADAKIHDWEEAVKADPAKMLGEVGSFLLNDSTRRYEGRDYEKVFLSVRLALDHLALGDMENARTEIKKMHEREAIIAEFRSKDLEKAKQEAEKKGVKVTSYKELKGYPVETLDDPQVQALKNSYESAFANYLAGFIYESLDEPSLATAGYRKAIEMHPASNILEDGLKGIDNRISRARKRNNAGVDTLFVVETGTAPALTSKTLPIPLMIPSTRGVNMVMIPISWPILQPVNISIAPQNIILDSKPLSIVMVTNVDQMARRALSDEMPGIIFRSSVRAIAKGVAQKAIQDNTGSLGMFGALINVAAGIAAVATEHADERTWRTLPAFYSVGRATLAPGKHSIGIDTPKGQELREIKLSGKYAVVVLNSSENSLYLAQTPYVEHIAEPTNPNPTVTEPSTPESTTTSSGKKTKKKKVKSEKVKVT